MFTYRNISFTFLLVILVFALSGVLLDGGFQVSGYGFLVSGFWLLASVLTILILGSVFIRWNFYFFSHNHGDRSSPAISITFDDGPDAATTPKILDILEKHQIKATFFCVGNKIEKNPDVFKKIIDMGHAVGNHTYSHSPWFDLFSSTKMAREISMTDEIFFNLTGKKPKLFRPPYGVTNPMLGKALKKTGHQSVAWSLRSFDTVKKPEKVLRKVNHKLKNGDIVLFHDRIPETAGIVEQFILEAQKSGNKFVPLDELLKIQPYASVQ
jgi:peptidoglycan/xylan/chitin deacetylase (PgdA/CDA1 family)